MSVYPMLVQNDVTDIANSGGGNTDNLSMDHSGSPLRWMAYEGVMQGLRMRPFNGQWSLEKLIDVNESLTGLWHILEYLPIMRLSYTDSNSLTRWCVAPS